MNLIVCFSSVGPFWVRLLHLKCNGGWVNGWSLCSAKNEMLLSNKPHWCLLRFSHTNYLYNIFVKVSLSAFVAGVDIIFLIYPIGWQTEQIMEESSFFSLLSSWSLNVAVFDFFSSRKPTLTLSLNLASNRMQTKRSASFDTRTSEVQISPGSWSK